MGSAPMKASLSLCMVEHCGRSACGAAESARQTGSWTEVESLILFVCLPFRGTKPSLLQFPMRHQDLPQQARSLKVLHAATPPVTKHPTIQHESPGHSRKALAFSYNQMTSLHDCCYHQLCNTKAK